METSTEPRTEPITVTLPVADLAALDADRRRLEAERAQLGDEVRALRLTLAVVQYALPNPPLPARAPNRQHTRTVPDPEDAAATERVGPARAPLAVRVNAEQFERVRGKRGPRRPRRRA